MCQVLKIGEGGVRNSYFSFLQKEDIWGNINFYIVKMNQVLSILKLGCSWTQTSNFHVIMFIVLSAEISDYVWYLFFLLQSTMYYYYNVLYWK
jgi:hypothetical protein